ncbi:MAG: ArnT family glycosyltransferase, partial [Methyloligellaceae bacterium]
MFYGGLLALWLTILLALRISVLYFSKTDLFFDEAQYWAWSQDPAFGYFSKPPLIAWIIGATTTFCGMSEFCVRLASPILHSVTAIVLFFLGHTLFGPRVGFWGALAFVTVPGVSLSATLISTDVP